MPDQNLEDRLKRADSWIQATAALRPEQLHESFIFLYIAFNCLYGQRQYEGDETQIGKDLAEFFKKVRVMSDRDVDNGGAILKRALAAAHRDGAILIRDKFLSNRYWRGGSSVALQKQLNKEESLVEEQFTLGSYDMFLDLTFRRISVLRNQIMHGCATYGARSYGQASLTKGLHFLKVMVPAFYELTKQYGHEVQWDPVPYPRSGSQQHPGV